MIKSTSVSTVVFAIILILTAGCLFAQPVTTISGTVIDAKTNEPLVGANVSVMGKTIGSATNAAGEFSFHIVLTEEVKLLVNYMGYKKQVFAIKPGDKTTGLVFKLEPDVIGLEAVVVTALGIPEEEKTIGYSHQSISSPELTEVAEPNIVSNLSGKAAGVQVITSSGTIGSSARIQIRGISSLTGDNQPLFVVDGVPINNTSRNIGAYGESAETNYDGAVDFGNAASDINPDDIKSINILKGANAAALYGSRALNGVVEITTKSGKGAGLIRKRGLGISYSSHITFRMLNHVFKLQNKYGQGSLDFSIGPVADSLASYGDFRYVDGNYGGINDGTDESWGPPLDGYLSEYYNDWYGGRDYIQIQGEGKPLLIPQFTSPLPDGTIDPSVSSKNRTPTPWISHPDNAYGYFETGFSQEHNISVYGGGQGANYRVSITRQDDKGIVPNTDQKRNSVYLSGNIQLSPKLSVSGVANYVNTANDNLVGLGYNTTNPMQQFTGWFGRQVDITYLKNHVEKADGTPIRWNYSYHDNPYWIANKNTNSRIRHRIFGHVNVNYKFNSWINLTARGGTDVYTENRKYVRAKLSNDWPDGQFTDNNDLTRETNFDVFVRANRSITKDISLKALVGANYRSNRYKWQQTFVDGLIVPGLYSVSNSSVTPTTDTDLRQTKHNSVYGRLSVGYKDYLFVETTGRNDWSSTLPEKNRSYFYPSVTTSFLFSDFMDIDPKTLFGKIRAGWARVGNAARPYSLIGTYTAADLFMGLANFTYGNTVANADLKPEQKTSIEVGTDLKFFNNRLGLSATYYKENTVNQILAVSVSGASGFASKWINAGEIQNKGVELSLNGTPVEKGKFRWDVDVNWAKNKNEVIKLYGSVESLELWGSAWGGLKFLARPGEPWGQLFGYPTKMHNGKPVLRPASAGYWAGTYWGDTDHPGVVGNVLPDWTGGIRNTFRYKNFSLSTLIDMSWGGDIFSVVNMFGWYSGILKESVTGTDYKNGDNTYKATPVTGDDIRREGGVLIDGYQMVISGGDTSYVKNDVAARANAWGECYWPSLGGHSISVFDATWIKLRSVSLSYRIPEKYVSKLGLMGVTVSLEGRNLLILYKKAPNIDPETGFSANIIQGVEQNQLPSTRIFGVHLKLDL